MNHPYMARGAALAAVLLFSAGGARAHQIWIEPTGKQVKVYFGEFGENLREASPGYLDKFVSLEAEVVAGDKVRPVPLAKEKDGYAGAVYLRKGESLLAVEPGYPAFEKKEGGKSSRSVWTPAALTSPGSKPRSRRSPWTWCPPGGRASSRSSTRTGPLPRQR